MRTAVLSAGKVAQQRVHQTVIAGSRLDDMAATEFTRNRSNPRMRRKQRGLLQKRLAGWTDHRIKIAHAFAAGDGHGIQSIAGPRLKQRRRVGVGPHVTLVFENRDTMRFQVQEMARVERIFTDQGIQEELDVYNPLIPEPGQLCATLFLELTTEEQMREWLPKLVGIERDRLVEVGHRLLPPAGLGQHGTSIAIEPDAIDRLHGVA